MKRNTTARQHNFGIVPGAEIPRSKFRMVQTRKQAFDASDLIPIMCEEVLPGDTWEHTESIMARLATPIAPAVDDITLETFYFYVPNRITWTGNTHQNKWEQFITGQDDTLLVPGITPYDGSTRTIPTGSLYDHFGLLPQLYVDEGNLARFNVLPFWAYFTIYNEWFRDQNLQEPFEWALTWTFSNSAGITRDGTPWDQMCVRANKRSDYFTRSLPWPQKGDAVEINLGVSAPVLTAPDDTHADWDNVMQMRIASSGATPSNVLLRIGNTDGQVHVDTTPVGGQGIGLIPSNLYADLANATAVTINDLRVLFQTQKLLERLARGGSRYVETILAQFGVRAPDYRINRPEYLGGSNIPITVNPIAQTAAYDAEPADAASPVGNLGAEMHASGHKRTFRYAAFEHGYIIGIAVVRATPTYQQGTRRHWRRSTWLDFYNPVFSHLGEQAVATQEIYQPANNEPANATWGYQERHAEYRYTPNEITGVLRSTAAQPLDWWHYAEEFANEPALNAEFITDKTQETLARSLATAPSAQWSAQIIMDIRHDSRVARLMPAYSVPGLVDRF